MTLNEVSERPGAPKRVGGRVALATTRNRLPDAGPEAGADRAALAWVEASPAMRRPRAPAAPRATPRGPPERGTMPRGARTMRLLPVALLLASAVGLAGCLPPPPPFFHGPPGMLGPGHAGPGWHR